MTTTEQLKLAATMMEMRDTMKRLYADRWAEVSQPYRDVIGRQMKTTATTNPLSAALPIAQAMKAGGHDPSLLTAVAVDMADNGPLTTDH